MYSSYFGIQEKPFNVTPDSRYFYMNPNYEEAYARLLYGIRGRKGFIVMTGAAGTGKTTLLRRLMDNPERNVRYIFLYKAPLTFTELVGFTCEELGLPVNGDGQLPQMQRLNDFLVEESNKGGTVVLVLDQAQNLMDDVLENLRLLSNLETASEKLLQIVLAGQSKLDVKLSRPQMRQIKNRVALHCRLDRLQDSEVGSFIEYRLRIAGCEREELFTANAIREVTSYSKGIPRLINILCGNALLIAYAVSAKTVSAEMIERAACDLRLHTAQATVAKAAAGKPGAERRKERIAEAVCVKAEEVVSQGQEK